jgi:uncharacterized membrane protein YkvA (DUF1232 family)
MKFFAQPLYNGYRTMLRNSKYRWVILCGSLLYLLSPVDVAPDFLPGVGLIDDGMIATILISEMSQLLLEQRKSRKMALLSVPAITSSSN